MSMCIVQPDMTVDKYGCFTSGCVIKTKHVDGQCKNSKNA